MGELNEECDPNGKADGCIEEHRCAWPYVEDPIKADELLEEYGYVCQPRVDCGKEKVIGDDHIKVNVECGAV